MTLPAQPIDAAKRKGAGRIAQCLWLAPLAVFVLDNVRAMRAADGAPASTQVLLWSEVLLAVALATRKWRTIAAEIGVLLARAAPFALWLVLVAFLALFASGERSAGLAAAAVFFAILAWASAFETQPRKRLVAQMGLLAAWLVLWMIAEYAVGAFVLPRRSHNKIYAEYHPVLGWNLRPGMSTYRADTGRMESTNSIGFRTPEVPREKPAGVQRILFLGDSHTEGYTVGDDETYTRLLDDALGPKVEVISLGVGGYSTDQELLAFLEYGRTFEPDLVVLQFCINDIPYNVLDSYWRGRKPTFARYGEELMLRGVPVPDRTSTGLIPLALRERSNIFTFVEGQLRAFEVERDEGTADMEEAWHVTRLLTRDLAAIVKRAGSRLVAFDVNALEPEFAPRLSALLKDVGVPELDITPAYRTPDYDQLWVGGHWNVEGQRRAAACLAPQLEECLQARTAAR